MEIKNFIHETLNKIHLIPDKKKLDIKREDKIPLSGSKYSISSNSLSFDRCINNRIINKNSITFGTLGQFLAANYIFDKNLKKTILKNIYLTIELILFLWTLRFIVYFKFE